VEAAEDSLVGEGSGRGRRASLIGKREGLVPAVCGVGEGGEPTWVLVAVSEEKARVLPRRRRAHGAVGLGVARRGPGRIAAGDALKHAEEFDNALTF
jgi:hypothetical protein